MCRSERRNWWDLHVIVSSGSHMNDSLAHLDQRAMHSSSRKDSLSRLRRELVPVLLHTLRGAWWEAWVVMTGCSRLDTGTRRNSSGERYGTKGCGDTQGPGTTLQVDKSPNTRELGATIRGEVVMNRKARNARLGEAVLGTYAELPERCCAWKTVWPWTGSADWNPWMMSKPVLSAAVPERLKMSQHVVQDLQVSS